MKKHQPDNIPNRSSRRITLLRWTMYAIAVLLMFWFRPSDSERRYVYEINRPWSYGLLTAPFDIPVRLDTVSAQQIRDSITANFEDVYTHNPTIVQQISTKATERLQCLTTLPLTRHQQQRITQAINDVYSTGVISRRQADTSNPNVRIIQGDVSRTIPASALPSPRRAYAMIDSIVSDPALHNALVAARISELIVPDVTYDSTATVRFRNDALQSALTPIGVLQHGERIIDRGDIVTPQLFTILHTYESKLAERGGALNASRYYPALGALIYIMLILGALMAYLRFFRRAYYDSPRTQCLLLSTVTAFTLVTYAMSSTFRMGVYLVPLAIVPIVVLVFLDSRTAFFTSVVTVLTCVMPAGFHWDYIAIQFIACQMALISIKELSKRSHLLRTALLVFLAYSVSYVAVELLQTGSMDSISPRMFALLCINAIFISFAYFIIFLCEKAFGFTSRVTLVELADINHPILRELSEQCPGTFNHSMGVSNLAAAAAGKLNANVQLVRAGSLYHDIGKLSNPAFFTENQHGVNPHDTLTPMQSASIVIGHVTDGLRRAEKAKLPESIRHFIAQHHGKGTARYFYTTYCNQHPGQDTDPTPFTYPGPNPTTRETSIVMMADSVEAASRSLTDYSPESIKALVDRIIDTQIAEGLHADSPLAFRDVKIIKDVFASRLRTMYHSRISYPEAVKPEAATQPSSK